MKYILPLESWSDSNKGFENLMASPAGRKIFETYLKGEFSAENLIFWNACNDLKSEKSQELFKEKVEIIFVNHLDSSSAYEVKSSPIPRDDTIKVIVIIIG